MSMKLQLIAKISDEDLFLKCVHERGTIFYKVNDQGAIEQVTYFSGSRIIVLATDSLSEDVANRVKAEGFKVDSLEIDEVQGYVKIVQGNAE
jgi:hypothetical protein